MDGELKRITLKRRFKLGRKRRHRGMRLENFGKKTASVGAEAEFQHAVLGDEEVIIPEGIWDDTVQEWSNSLVGYFFGTRPNIGKIMGFVRTRWGDAEVAQLEAGVYLFSFKNKKDKDKVLAQGPWTFDNRPLLLKPWAPNEVYSMDNVASLPVWVRLPRLPVHLRRIDVLSLITSTLGRPVRTDGYTNGRSKLMYARILVEVYASMELKYSIRIKGPNGISFDQRVEYDWLPPRCKHCQLFGHSDHLCKQSAEIETEKEKEDLVIIEPADEVIKVDKIIKSTTNSVHETSNDFSMASMVLETQIALGDEEGGKSNSGQLLNLAAEETNAEETGEVSSRSRDKVLEIKSDKDIDKLQVEGRTQEKPDDSEDDRPFTVVSRRKKDKKESKSQNWKNTQDSEMNMNLKSFSRRAKGKGIGAKLSLF